MTRQAIIEQTIRLINQLPQDKAEEISDFADFVFKKYEDQVLIQGIQQLSMAGQTFQFLSEEEDLYSVADIKERYHD